MELWDKEDKSDSWWMSMFDDATAIDWAFGLIYLAMVGIVIAMIIEPSIVIAMVE